jgi:hypothetical protein
MRKIATIRQPIDDIRRVMLSAADEGAYLFLYRNVEDGPCEFDEWYESIDAAEEAATKRFALLREDWIAISDPPAGAQHDWIRPTRLKRDKNGKAILGKYEPMPIGIALP